jgi:hypothetical protein
VASNDREGLALKPVLTIPTGRKPNERELLDAPTGDGRFKAGLTLIHDVKIPADFRWSQTLGYSLLLPNKMYRRIPKSVQDPLSDDTELVSRRTGEIFTFGTGLDRTLPRIGMTLGVSYNYQHQSQQRFGGSNPNPMRYRALEELFPSQSLHSYTLSASFSTVEWYRAARFIYPFEANVAYSAPITGQNVPTSPLMTGELVLFF